MRLRYILDASRFNGVETFYDEIMRVFSLPDYFGRNLDALYDSLSSIEGGIEIIWINSIKSRKDFADDVSQSGFFGQVVETLKDVPNLKLRLE